MDTLVLVGMVLVQHYYPQRVGRACEKQVSAACSVVEVWAERVLLFLILPVVRG